MTVQPLTRDDATTRSDTIEGINLDAEVPCSSLEHEIRRFPSHRADVIVAFKCPSCPRRVATPECWASWMDLLEVGWECSACGDEGDYDPTVAWIVRTL